VERGERREGRKWVKGYRGGKRGKEGLECWKRGKPWKGRGKWKQGKGGNVVVERTGEREGKGEKREKVVDRVKEGERKEH